MSHHLPHDEKENMQTYMNLLDQIIVTNPEAYEEFMGFQLVEYDDEPIAYQYIIGYVCDANDPKKDPKNDFTLTTSAFIDHTEGKISHVYFGHTIISQRQMVSEKDFVLDLTKVLSFILDGEMPIKLKDYEHDKEFWRQMAIVLAKWVAVNEEHFALTESEYEQIMNIVKKDYIEENKQKNIFATKKVDESLKEQNKSSIHRPSKYKPGYCIIC